MTEPSEEATLATMRALIVARDLGSARLNEPGYDEWLAWLGIDGTAPRLFARRCEAELEGFEVGAAAIFVAGFATALELLTDTAPHSAAV